VRAVPTVVGTGAIKHESLGRGTRGPCGESRRAWPDGDSAGAVARQFRAAQQIGSISAAILSAAPALPAVIYNSPYYGFATRADLFFELRENHPNLVGFKEFGGADDLRYAAENITSRDDNVTLMVGVDTAVFHGFVNCGATGAITGIGNALPREVLHLVALCRKAAEGHPEARRRAQELEEALAVLSSFDEGPGPGALLQVSDGAER
jgi:dihydrodipicolinate synthase/N-acetylneuraminate lyase